MAERRMISKTIIDSDLFLDMPVTARLLYYDLIMCADDDGFVDSPKKIMRMVGASQDDLKLLIAKNFIIAFDSGVVAIKHWRFHNYIRKDTYKPTIYKNERARLKLDTNNVYELQDDIIENGVIIDNYADRRRTVDEPSTNRRRTVNESLTQDSIGKDSIGKDSIGKDSIERGKKETTAKRFVPPSIEEVRAYCLERNNTVDPEQFVDFYTSKGWKVGKESMKDWKAAVRTWEKRDNRAEVPKATPKTPKNVKQGEARNYDLAALERKWARSL